MARKFQRVTYARLNARQKESFNYQKISALLAEFGFVTIRLSDDWKGADFLAQHIDGETLRVQLKSRLTFQKKYQGKDLWVCFPEKDRWYLYPHDELLAIVLKERTIADTASWKKAESYSFPYVSQQLEPLLAPYLLS